MAKPKRKIWMIESELKASAQQTDNYIREHFQKRRQDTPKRSYTLIHALEYSLFTGGKRFRPAVTLFTGEAFGVSNSRLVPYATAIELIHTYSLIHDDLPSLDNDKYRRGKPTNHQVYGEALAILAGDALLTECWHLISTAYKHTPSIAIELIEILSEAAGATGMIAGQVMDLDIQHKLNINSNSEPSIDELLIMHRLKTAALIRAAAEGAAVIARTSEPEQKNIRAFGESLGLAFQLADDIHDYKPEDPESTGFPKWIGLDQTKTKLEEVTKRTSESLSFLHTKASKLQQLVELNLRRQQ